MRASAIAVLGAMAALGTPRSARWEIPPQAAAPAYCGFPSDDEHVKATGLGIADELTQDGLVLRYRV